MTLPEFETILYEERDGIAIITMNRPERLNALNGTMHQEIYEAWELAMTHDSVKVIVFAGTGRAFCSGADLRERGEARQRGTVIEREKRQNNIRPPRFKLTGSFPGNNNDLELDKPVVGAINGLVVGAGTMIAGAIDILIATEGAYVADAHVTYAGWPGTGEELDITDKMPWGEVIRVAIEGIKTRISGKRCYQLGFYNEIVEADQVMPRAMEIAQMIAAQPAEVVKAFRRVAHRSRDLALRDSLIYGQMEDRRLKMLAEVG